MNPSQTQLVFWWGSFIFLWCGATLLLVGPVNYLSCNAENLELEHGSAKGSYCDGIRDFMKSGEPSELTTPLPYLFPVALLAAVGGYGVWRRSNRILSRAAIVAVAGLILHVILLILLPG